MKKTMTLILAVLLLTGMAVTGTAAAEGRTVVTALAAEVNPDHLVSIAIDAKITGYDPESNLASITILVPERYRPEEIGALKVGDAIYTQGKEVDIRTISDVDGYIVLNEGAEDEVYLFESVDLNYWIMDVNDNTWTELYEGKVPVSDHFLLLDEINPATGEGLLYPTVHNRAEFSKIMKNPDDPGFDIRNVKAVFDEHGDLAVIRRIYVPWQ